MSTRTLASFIAIARADLRSAKEKRMARTLIFCAGLLAFVAVAPTSYRFWFLAGSVVLIVALVGGSYRRAVSFSPSEDKVDASHLFDYLDFNRAQSGLEAVVDVDMLSALEREAQVWETIEAALQSEGWRSQELLRERVQGVADQSMSELITLGTSNATKAGHRSWHEAWDQNSATLRSLLGAMREAERVLFLYPREEDMPNSAPPPEVPELARLNSLISGQA